MYKVELTEGWDGKALRSAVVETRADATQWLTKNIPKKYEWNYWRYTVTSPSIVDFGSWTHFGRISELEETSVNNTSKKENTNE